MNMEYLKTTEGILIFTLVGLLIFFWVLFEIIRAAVRKALIEAHKINHSKPKENIRTSVPQADWTPKQLELQKKYEKGEISIDEYRQTWGQE